MPICSYLAYPVKGEKKELADSLEKLNYCEVIPSDNVDVVILLTDTPDDEAEQWLHKQLKDVELLQHLSMTFGQVVE